jgi:hypothetical protein
LLIINIGLLLRQIFAPVVQFIDMEFMELKKPFAGLRFKIEKLAGSNLRMTIAATRNLEKELSDALILNAVALQ